MISPPPVNKYETLDREVSLGSAAIGRLDVCNSSFNRRLKGIRIWGETINDDGSTSFYPGSDSEEFPNCDGNWSPSVMCPGDRLATGVVVDVRDRAATS